MMMELLFLNPCLISIRDVCQISRGHVDFPGRCDVCWRIQDCQLTVNFGCIVSVGSKSIIGLGVCPFTRDGYELLGELYFKR